MQWVLLCSSPHHLRSTSGGVLYFSYLCRSPLLPPSSVPGCQKAVDCTSQKPLPAAFWFASAGGRTGESLQWGGEVLLTGLCEGVGSRVGTAAGGAGGSSSFTLGFCSAAASPRAVQWPVWAPRQGQYHCPDLWVASPSPCISGHLLPHAPAALPTALKSLLDLKSLSEIPKKVAAFLIEPYPYLLGLWEQTHKHGAWAGYLN